MKCGGAGNILDFVSGYEFFRILPTIRCQNFIGFRMDTPGVAPGGSRAADPATVGAVYLQRRPNARDKSATEGLGKRVYSQ